MASSWTKIWSNFGIFSMFGTCHGKYTKISNYKYLVTLKTMVDIKINDTQKFWSLWRHHGPRFGSIWIIFNFCNFHDEFMKISNCSNFVTLKTMVDIKINDTRKFWSLWRHHGPRFRLILVYFLSSALVIGNTRKFQIIVILLRWKRWQALKLIIPKNVGHYDVIMEQDLG